MNKNAYSINFKNHAAPNQLWNQNQRTFTLKTIPNQRENLWMSKKILVHDDVTVGVTRDEPQI